MDELEFLDMFTGNYILLYTTQSYLSKKYLTVTELCKGSMLCCNQDICMCCLFLTILCKP